MIKIKPLIILAAMICCSISTLSQSNQIDATLVPNAKLRDAAKLIEKGKIDAERVVLLNEKIDFLNQRIALKDSIINSHVIKDSAQIKEVDTYKAELKNLIEQRDIAVKEMKHQNKLLKRQKRLTIFAGLGGIAITTALFLFIK